MSEYYEPKVQLKNDTFIKYKLTSVSFHRMNILGFYISDSIKNNTLLNKCTENYNYYDKLKFESNFNLSHNVINFEYLSCSNKKTKYWTIYNSSKPINFEFMGFDFSVEFITDFKNSQTHYNEGADAILSYKEVTISTLAPYNMIDKLIDNSLMYYFDKCYSKRSQLPYYFAYNSEWQNWEHMGVISKKELSTIYLPEKDIESVISCMEKFRDPYLMKRKKELGYSNKMTYLFEGIWGSGKTSLITALAYKYNRDVYTIPMRSSLDDYSLMNAMKKIRTPSFLVFEDIDSIFDKREKNNDINSDITFSGLLNTLDGIFKRDGIEIFMTTNYIQNLDAALMRPGRVDFILKFTYATEKQIKDMYEKTTYANTEQKNRFYEEFVKLDINITMAILQNYLMPYIDSPEEAIININEIHKYLQ